MDDTDHGTLVSYLTLQCQIKLKPYLPFVSRFKLPCTLLFLRSHGVLNGFISIVVLVHEILNIIIFALIVNHYINKSLDVSSTIYVTTCSCLQDVFIILKGNRGGPFRLL